MKQLALFCGLLSFAIILGCNKSQYPKREEASSAAQKSIMSANKILQSAITQEQLEEPYEIKSAYKFVRSSGKNKSEKNIPQNVVRKNINNFRLKMPKFAVVSNDSLKWIYRTDKNEYMEKHQNNTSSTSDLLKVTQKAQNNFAKVFQSYGDSMGSRVKNVSLTGTDTLVLDDNSPHIVDKIQVTYIKKKKSPLSKFDVSPTTYSIEKNTHLVLGRNMTMSRKIKHGGKTIKAKLKLAYRVKHVDVNPTFSDSTFIFHPPKGAQKVGKMNLGQHAKKSTSANAVGNKAPNFHLATFNGKKVSLKDYRGHVVVLDFWATWCGPCRKSHPHLQKLYEANKDKGLVVLGVNNERKKKVRAYMRKHDYTFTNLNDAKSKVQQKYGVSAIPTEYIINPSGKVVDYLRGYHPQSGNLRSALKKAGLSL